VPAIAAAMAKLPSVEAASNASGLVVAISAGQALAVAHRSAI